MGELDLSGRGWNFSGVVIPGGQASGAKRILKKANGIQKLSKFPF